MKHTDQSPQEREREELERQVEILRREVRQLRLEQDLLNKANELLKKGLGVDLQLLSNREKTLLIDALKEHYHLPELLAQLGIARSSYFYHRSRTAVGDKYLVVRQSLTEIFESNHRCYGYPLALSALSNTGRALDLRRKPVQVFIRIPTWVSSRWKSTPSRNGPINWRAFISAA